MIVITFGCEGKILLLKTLYPLDTNLEESSWCWTENFLLEGELSWNLKVLCKIPGEKSDQKSYLAVMPIHHHKIISMGRHPEGWSSGASILRITSSSLIGAKTHSIDENQCKNCAPIQVPWALGNNILLPLFWNSIIFQAF